MLKGSLYCFGVATGTRCETTGSHSDIKSQWKGGNRKYRGFQIRFTESCHREEELQLYLWDVVKAVLR